MKKRQFDALAARRERKLRNWIRRQSEREPGDTAAVLWCAACVDPYLDRLLAALKRPELLRELEPGPRDRFAWNLGYDLEWVISQSREPRESLLRVLAAVPFAFEGAFGGESEEATAGMYMFWDGVCGMAERSPQIQEAIFEALVVQLDSADRGCQQSALHGFNHLEDERCRPIIDSFQRRCDDPQMVAYAEASKNFRTP